MFHRLLILAALSTGVVTDAAAQRLGVGGTGVDETVQLPRCDAPLGTVALVEEKRSTNASGALPPQFAALLELAERQEGRARVDPLPLLKLLAAQSGCFLIVDRGEGFDALQRERQLAAGQQLVGGSGVGGQTLQAADWMLTAQVIYQDSNAGGGGGGAGGFGDGVGSAIGIKTNRLESQTMLTLVAVRSGVQEAIATGSARKKDVKVLGGGLIGLGIGALAGGYGSTDIGKITSLALLDAYRKLVPSAQAAVARRVAAAPSVQPAVGGALQVPTLPVSTSVVKPSGS